MLSVVLKISFYVRHTRSITFQSKFWRERDTCSAFCRHVHNSWRYISASRVRRLSRYESKLQSLYFIIDVLRRKSLNHHTFSHHTSLGLLESIHSSQLGTRWRGHHYRSWFQKATVQRGISLTTPARKPWGGNTQWSGNNDMGSFLRRISLVLQKYTQRFDFSDFSISVYCINETKLIVKYYCS